eukprot:2163128-Rhodomonas_salina.2
MGGTCAEPHGGGGAAASKSKFYRTMLAGTRRGGVPRSGNRVYALLRLSISLAATSVISGVGVIQGNPARRRVNLPHQGSSQQGNGVFQKLMLPVRIQHCGQDFFSLRGGSSEEDKPLFAEEEEALRKVGSP